MTTYGLPYARGTLLTIAGMLFQQALTFATGVIVARTLGAAEYGIIAILRNVTFALLALTPLGLDLALLKHVGRLEERPDGPDRVLLILRACVFLLNAALVVSVPLGVGTFVEEAIYIHAGFAWALLITLVGLTFAADLAILGALYRTVNRSGPFALMTLFVQPVVRLGLVLALLADGWGMLGVVWANAAAFVVSAILVSVHLAARHPAGRTAAPTPERSGAWRDAGTVLRDSVWMAPNLFAYGMMRFADGLLLGMMVTAKEVGEYGALGTVAQLVQVYPMALAQTLGPRIALRHRAGDVAGMQGEIDDYMRQAVLVGSFVFGGVAVFGDRLDLIFGPSFGFRPDIALLMALGWLLSAVFAPAGYCLSMTGRHKMELAILALGAAALVTGCLLLIPQLGQLGAAIAVTFAFALVNAVRIAVIVRRFGFIPGRMADLLPPLVALALALVSKVAFEVALGRAFAPLLLSCCLYAALYGVFALRRVSRYRHVAGMPAE